MLTDARYRTLQGEGYDIDPGPHHGADTGGGEPNQPKVAAQAGA
jgi:hypothetical protein